MGKIKFLKDLKKLLKKHNAEIMLSLDDYELFAGLDFFVNVKHGETEWIYAEGTYGKVTINCKTIQSLIDYVKKEELHEKKEKNQRKK
jgi:hypothetical protein